MNNNIQSEQENTNGGAYDDFIFRSFWNPNCLQALSAVNISVWRFLAHMRLWGHQPFIPYPEDIKGKKGTVFI